MANNLNRSYWTVKTQKKSIYQKLGISKDTELLWYMILEKLERNFDLRELRKHGLELLMALLFIVLQVTGNAGDLRRCRTARRARTEIKSDSK